MATGLPGVCPCDLETKGATAPPACEWEPSSAVASRTGHAGVWADSFEWVQGRSATFPNCGTFAGTCRSLSLCTIPRNQSSLPHLRNCLFWKGFWTSDSEDWVNHTPQSGAHNFPWFTQGTFVIHSFNWSSGTHYSQGALRVPQNCSNFF